METYILLEKDLKQQEHKTGSDTNGTTTTIPIQNRIAMKIVKDDKSDFLYPYSKGMKALLAQSIEPRSARAELTNNNRSQNTLDDDQTSQHRRCAKYTDTLKNCSCI